MKDQMEGFKGGFSAGALDDNSENVFQYCRVIREKMNEYADFISGGACKDYSEYTKVWNH